MSIPGVFWPVLIVTLVPVLLPVIQNQFPAANYWWSAILVVVLAGIAKTTEIVYRKQIAKANAGPTPSAAAAPVDGDDYTYNGRMPKQPSTLRQWILG